MVTQTPTQKKMVTRVMRAFKNGDLEQRDGERVTNPKQAIAIALHEAGASRDEDAKTNAHNLRRTKQEAAEDRHPATRAHGRSKAQLYAEARRRNLAGRSGMTKDELAKALSR